MDFSMDFIPTYRLSIFQPSALMIATRAYFWLCLPWELNIDTSIARQFHFSMHRGRYYNKSHVKRGELNSTATFPWVLILKIPLLKAVVLCFSLRLPLGKAKKVS
jgi:hypothetical protein